MKKPITLLIVSITFIIAAASAASAGCMGNCGGMQGGGMYGPTGAIASTLPYDTPDENETAGLVQMREEEKLARDVYAAMYEKWNNLTFELISTSEQRHMDAVKTLLDKYGITDPVVDDARGVFQDSALQELYNTLVAQGNASLEQALLVGATIEDLDIHDLQTLIAATDNEDILVVYQNLAKGSRNHMRHFAAELATFGVTYSAQYLTQDEVDQIISSPMERGRYDKDGKPMFTAPMGNGRHTGMGRGNGSGQGGCTGAGRGMNFVDENNNGICDLME